MLWASKAVKDFRKKCDNSVKVDLGDMWHLKKCLQEHIALPRGVSECSIQEVFDALVPQFYSESKLKDLLLETTNMREWFLVSDGHSVVFNFGRK